MHKYVPIDKNIHILFYEQAVCRRGQNKKKTYLMSLGDISEWVYHSLTGSETPSLLFKEQRPKKFENCFEDCHMIPYEVLMDV